VLILPRYVLRAVVTQVVGVIAVLFLIVVVLQFTRVLARAAADRFPTDLLLTLVAWGAAQNVAVIIPIGLSLGIVLGLGRLYEDHEMAAMASCGAGGPRVTLPLVGLVVLTSAALAWLSLVYNPHAAAETEARKGLALQIGAYINPRPAEFRSFNGGRLVLYAGQVDADGKLTDVFAQRLGEDDEAVVVARSGRIARNEQGLPTAIVLNDGTYYALLSHGLRQRIVRFSEQHLPVQLPTSTRVSARTDAIPTRTLLLSSRPQDIAEWQGRLALAVMALVLGLLAIPLSRLRPREGRYGRAALVIVVYFVYANVIIAGETWIANGRTPAWLGLWWVHGLIAAIALMVYAVANPWHRSRALPARTVRAAT